MKKGSLVSALLVSGVLILLLQKVIGLDWSHIATLLGQLSPVTVGVIWLLYLGYLWIKALRLGLLLGRGVPLARLFAVSMVYQLLTLTLPFRAGDVTLLTLLKPHGIAMAHSLAVLLLSKLVELTALLFYFLVILIVFKRQFIEYGGDLWTMLVVVPGGILVVVAGLWLFRQKAGLWLMAHVVKSRLPRREWLLDRLTVFQEGMGQCGHDTLARALLLAVVARPLNALVLVVFFADLAPQVAWQTVVVGELLFFLVSQLPIQGVLGVGSFHALFVLVFAGMGVDSRQALALSVALHAISLLLSGVTGGQGMVLGRWLDHRHPLAGPAARWPGQDPPVGSL